MGSPTWATAGEALSVTLTLGWNKFTVQAASAISVLLLNGASVRVKVMSPVVGSGSVFWTVRVTWNRHSSPGARTVPFAQSWATMAPLWILSLVMLVTGETGAANKLPSLVCAPGLSVA